MTPRLCVPTNLLAGPFSGDKILWQCEALAAIRDGGIPAPIVVEFDPTNVCTMNCSYCTNDVYRAQHRATLDVEVAKTVIRDLAHLGTKAVTITGGGEPLTHPQIAEILFEPVIWGREAALITNGALLHRDTLKPHLEELTRKYLWIRISVDAYDRASYVQSKGVDLFDRVLDNVRTLVAAKHRSGGHCAIGVGLLTSSSIRYPMAETAEFWREVGVDYVQFRPMTFLGGDERRFEHNLVDVVTKDVAAAKALKTDAFEVYASTPKYDDVYQTIRPYKYCSGVYFSCVIGATGDVWVCCHMRGNEKFSLGNVKVRKFADIWYDAANRNEVYRRIGDFEECMPLCRFHGQNKLLANINWAPMHVNFL